MIYTVTFNPALDYVVCVPQLALGQVNRTEKEELQFGGKGINVSVMLSRLSVPNCALGFIAGFTGKALEEELRKNRISTDFICLKEGLTRINLKMKAQQETEINAKGPKIQESDIELLFQKLEQLKQGDILVLAGSVPMGVPQNIYEKMMKKVSGKGVFTVVDTNGGLLSSVLKEQPFLIKPNQIELGELLGKTLKTPQEVEEGARALQKKGARNVLVSMAGAGAMLLDENGKLVQDIDCGVWDTDPVEEHNATATAHANLLVDGNNVEAVDTSESLEEHMANPLAHQNLVIDGNAGQ